MNRWVVYGVLLLTWLAPPGLGVVDGLGARPVMFRDQPPHVLDEVDAGAVAEAQRRRVHLAPEA